MNNKVKPISGFTLLEVIIAVTILAFISLFTSRMIQQGAKSKAKIQQEMDRANALHAALELMSRDIGLSFHYRDINVELYNAAQKERKKRASPAKKNPADTGSPNPPTPPPPPVDPNQPDPYKLKEEKIHTRFIGENEKLDFTTLNYFRSIKNMPVSDQAEVGYYIEKCSSRLNKEKTSNCLWRRISPYIDDDVKDGGSRAVLLENVKELTFRYIGPGHEEEWVESWRSIDGEEVMKNKFPYAVEITLTVYDTKFNPPKEVAMTVVAPLRFPNNKPDEKSNVVN